MDLVNFEHLSEGDEIYPDEWMKAEIRIWFLTSVGKEFNPVKVGLKYERDKNMMGLTKSCGKGEQSCFEPALTGNHNTGHEGRYYGTDLPDADKHILIEYLKVLPPEPEYSWQFVQSSEIY